MMKNSCALEFALLLSIIGFTAGDRCLFMGHSFFHPVAKKLPDLIPAGAGLNHTQVVVQSGGESGLPSSLWNNTEKRTEIMGFLDAGDIEVFGMTMEPNLENPLDTWPTESYERWIDYALSKNPNTKIMIGAFWNHFPEEFDTLAYTALSRKMLESKWPGIFTRLRAKYPMTKFIDNPYALGTVELRLLFDAGELPDITSLTGNGATSIFTDAKGHGGQILLDLLSVVWVNRIYGVRQGNPDFKWSADLKKIALSVLDAYDAGSLCGTTACSLAS